jgi:hypothetical protein
MPPMMDIFRELEACIWEKPQPSAQGQQQHTRDEQQASAAAAAAAETSL